MNKVYGKNHFRASLLLSDLGGLEEELGNFVQAEQYFQDALDICLRTLGENHPHTQALKSNFAKLLFTTGRYEQAQALFSRILSSESECFR